MRKPLFVALVAVLAVSVAAAGPDKLTEIRKFHDRGMDQTARKMLDAHLAANPDDAAANALLATVLIALGDPAGAETAGAKAVDLDEDSAANWKVWGLACFEQGVAAVAAQADSNTIKSYFADAEWKFRQVAQRDDKDPDLRWYQGWAKEWQEYPVEARKLYDEQIAKHPKVIGGYRRLGQMLASEANGIGNGTSAEANAKRAEAIKVFEDGLSACGDDAETLYLLGFAHEWAGKKDAAKDCYLRAVKADPEFHKAWKRAFDVGVPADDLKALALALLKKDKTAANAAMWACFFLLKTEASGDDEVALCQEVLALAMPALTEHGENYGLYSQAFIAATRLFKVKPEPGADAFKRLHEAYVLSGDAANNLGLFYRDTQRYEESLEWYLKAAERSPDVQGIQNDTGLIYLFHASGETRKRALPYLLRTVELVQDVGQEPEMGYWDALENLCKYYWEVEKDPEKVVQYSDMRYQAVRGTAPYNMSEKARHYGDLARKELGR